MESPSGLSFRNAVRIRPARTGGETIWAGRWRWEDEGPSLTSKSGTPAARFLSSSVSVSP
jgi:hypothetical protein